MRAILPRFAERLNERVKHVQWTLHLVEHCITMEKSPFSNNDPQAIDVSIENDFSLYTENIA